MQNYDYQEINLADYVKVIFKRKWLITGLVALALISSFIYSSISPKIYKIDSALELGAIDESPAQLIEKINNQVYNGEYKIGVHAENPKNTNLINLISESADYKNAQMALNEISNAVLIEHQKWLEIQKKLIQNDIAKIRNKIKLIDGGIQNNQNKIIFLDQDIESNQSKISLIQNNIEQTKSKKDIINSNIQTIKNKIATNQDDIQRLYNKIDSQEKEKQALRDKVSALEEQLIYKQDPGTQFALFSAKQELENKNQEIENLYLQINSLQRTIEDYNMQINSLEREKKDIDIQVNSLESSKQDYNLAINSLESSKQDYNIQINSLMAGKDDFELEINQLNKSLQKINPTKIIKSPTVSKFPIKPRPLLNTAIAGALGLFIGVFLAFIREWWQENL